MYIYGAGVNLTGTHSDKPLATKFTTRTHTHTHKHTHVLSLSLFPDLSLSLSVSLSLSLSPSLSLSLSRTPIHTDSLKPRWPESPEFV